MTIMADNRMMAQMSSKDGFIAALDQNSLCSYPLAERDSLLRQRR
jgi:hypothetical protein